jgi:hypothetical protein
MNQDKGKEDSRPHTSEKLASCRETCMKTEFSLNKQVLGHIPNTKYKLFNFLTYLINQYDCT